MIDEYKIGDYVKITSIETGWLLGKVESIDAKINDYPLCSFINFKIIENNRYDNWYVPCDKTKWPESASIEVNRLSNEEALQFIMEQ
jgi:hypothetical protein